MVLCFNYLTEFIGISHALTCFCLGNNGLEVSCFFVRPSLFCFNRGSHYTSQVYLSSFLLYLEPPRPPQAKSHLTLLEVYGIFFRDIISHDALVWWVAQNSNGWISWHILTHRHMERPQETSILCYWSLYQQWFVKLILRSFTCFACQMALASTLLPLQFTPKLASISTNTDRTCTRQWAYSW